MQNVDWDSQLDENGTTEETFAKTHGIIVLDLSGNQDTSIVQICTVRLECSNH